MTKQEAVEIFKNDGNLHYDTETGEWHGLSPNSMVDCLVELGLLKLEEPMTATERALTAINEYARRDGIYSDIFRNGTELIELLNVAGVRIVDK